MTDVIERLTPDNRVCPCGFDPIHQFQTRSYILVSGSQLSIIVQNDDGDVSIKDMNQYACPICGTLFIIT